MKPTRHIFAAGLLMVVLFTHFSPLNSQPASAQSPLPDSFNSEEDGFVYSLAIQSDGRILAGGDFITLGGQARNRTGLLKARRTLDTPFNQRAKVTTSNLPPAPRQSSFGMPFTATSQPMTRR